MTEVAPIEDAVSNVAEAEMADEQMRPPMSVSTKKKSGTTGVKRSRSTKSTPSSGKRAALQHKVFIVTHLPRPVGGGFHRTAIATAASEDVVRQEIEKEFDDNADLALVEIHEVDTNVRHFYDMSLNMKSWPPSEGSDSSADSLRLFIAQDYDQSFLMPSVAVIVAEDKEDAKALLELENARYDIETAPEFQLDELEVKHSDRFYVLSPGTLRPIDSA